MFFKQGSDFSLFKKRREKLLDLVKSFNIGQSGVMLFFAGFERERYNFRQESSFYYLTGITDPAVVLAIHLDGRHVLYVPNFGDEREKWVNVGISSKSDPTDFGFDEIKKLSEQVVGYSYSSFFSVQRYTFLINDIKKLIGGDFSIYTFIDNVSGCFEQVTLFEKLEALIPRITIVKKDVSSFVHQLRFTKGADEIILIQQAIDLTIKAQFKAARLIKPSIYEHQVKAGIEYLFSYNGAETLLAFPSIIAAGKNSTVLHYVDRNKSIKDGDLVVVDIGAEFGYYAADLTRTYPANGRFTERQKEIYQAVLDTQKYIVSKAKPGMFLLNLEAKEQSLYYLAKKFLEKRGLIRYFPHGIGHYMGLDVHDVGVYSKPLEPGVVFTIEPGVYIPQESLGVRIEDDYLMQENGVVCLSDELPKEIDDIENMVACKQ